LTTGARRWTRALPGAALGLWLARVGGEQAGLPGVWAAVLLSGLLAAAGAWLLARWPLGRTWPALLLLAYVIQPEVAPSVRTGTLFVALAALALNEFDRWSAARHGNDVARPRPLTWLISALLFVAFLALYLVTLAPDVLAADSGELQGVAAQLGVAHPPGFPLYVMLAHLFTRLPIGSPAYAVNLLSAVFGALTVVVVYRSGLLLTGRHLPALLGAVALGTATTFWSQATTANVRSLTALFAALAIHALLELRIATRGHKAAAEPGQHAPNGLLASPVSIRIANIRSLNPDRRLTLFALVMGFGLTHHVSLAFLALVGLLFVLAVDPPLVRSPRRWWRPLAAALLGLLPLLYLPLRAGAEVRGASPELATLPGFLEHVLATGFRGDLFYYLAPAELGPRLLVMGNVMTFQFAPLLLAAMLIGLLLMLWRDRPLALLLGGAFAVYVFVAATYRAPQTVEYMMPAYVPAALALAFATGRLPDALPRWRGVGPALAALLAALALVAALGQLPGHISAAGANHEATDARDTVGFWLDQAPRDSVILAHWHWATPLWYLQEVEGRRPDVDVRFVFPTGEPYDTTWARRTAEAFAEGRPVVTTWLPTAPLADLPVPEPMGEAILYPQQPREGLPVGYEPAQVTLGGGIEVLGYRIEEPRDVMLTPGAESVIAVAWRPKAALPADLSLFLHLVGEDGVLVAQDDRPARAAEGITLTQFRATPRPATPIGDLTVFIGASADGQRQTLTTIGIAHTNDRPLTRNPVHRALVDMDAATLIGYDWDHTLDGRDRLYLHWAGDFLEGYWTTVVDDAAIAALELPPYRGPWGVPVRVWRFPRGQDGGHYVPLGQSIVWTGGTLNGVSAAPGESLTLNQEFRSGQPINRDYVVSVRLIGLEPDGFHWAWWDLQDSVPAMGAIPTLKWVDGSIVRSPHRVTVAPDAPPGQTLTGALTLYDSFTNRPLAILDERLTDEQPWIPLCRAEVE
jgi:hypothetical protein